jgi:hypothetical protein
MMAAASWELATTTLIGAFINLPLRFFVVCSVPDISMARPGSLVVQIVIPVIIYCLLLGIYDEEGDGDSNTPVWASSAGSSCNDGSIRRDPAGPP